MPILSLNLTIQSISNRYPSDEKARQDVLQNMPDQIGTELHSKSSELHSRLKHVSKTNVWYFLMPVGILVIYYN